MQEYVMGGPGPEALQKYQNRSDPTGLRRLPPRCNGAEAQPRRDPAGGGELGACDEWVPERHRDRHQRWDPGASHLLDSVTTSAGCALLSMRASGVVTVEMGKWAAMLCDSCLRGNSSSDGLI